MSILIDKFQGIWKVTCYDIAAPINKVGDIKIIDGNTGYNVMCNKEWGFFSIEEQNDILILNYNDPRNSPSLCRVRDKIKPDQDGWTGTYYFFGIKVFTFRLDRQTEQ